MTKKQIWINEEDRKRLRILAAIEGKELMQMIKQNLDVYEIMSEVAKKRGKTINEVMEELAALRLPDLEAPVVNQQEKDQ